MRRLRRTSLTVLVWLTAAMTLVACAPRFPCQCPNGRVKLFCIGMMAKKSGCCCDGECCTKTDSVSPIEKKSTSEPEASTSCCCQHQGAARAVLASDPGCFTGPCCTKSFHRPEVSVIPYSEKPVLEDVALQALLASRPVVTPTVPSEPWAFRREHQRPPPTDLVITLQHFLI